jgi:AAA15 family ATPase/GTPase
MYYNNPFDLPQELLDDRPSQVNILVGENGSGKSSLLDQLSRRIVNHSERKVVAIANTIHDKFKTRHPNFEVLKAASGRVIVKRTLKMALEMLSDNKESRFNEVAGALEYVNFDPVIGLKIAGLKTDVESRLKYAEMPEEQRLILSTLLARYGNSIRRNSRNGIIPISFYRLSFYELQESGILELLKFESQLRRFKLIREIEVYLQKDGRFIPADMGSSGELTLISSFIYLIVTVEPGTIIFIDEPENSLHPKWQIEYVRTLYDFVHRYQPTAYIATHSPLIVNSAELDLGERLSIFKGGNGTFSRMVTGVNNVEEVYRDFFDVTTPENRFLSNYVVTKLNQLAAKSLPIEIFRDIIRDLSRSAYDPKQIEVLDGVLEMGERIAGRSN